MLACDLPFERWWKEFVGRGEMTETRSFSEDDAMPGFRRVLHATDLSPASARAFKSALDLAKASKGRLLLLYVVPPPQAIVLADVPPPADLYAKWDAEARASAQRQLERLVRRARRAGVRATILLTSGPVADRIIAVARRTKVDVIVMGTHGRTGLARAFVGSIAGRVVATASRPVLTIRGR